jgi:hypothetical protein
LNDEDRERLIRIEAKLHQTQWLVLICFCGGIVMLFCQTALPEDNLFSWLFSRAVFIAIAMAVMMYVARLAGVRWRS